MSLNRAILAGESRFLDTSTLALDENDIAGKRYGMVYTSGLLDSL